MINTRYFTRFFNNRIIQHLLFWGFFIFFETVHIYDKMDDQNIFLVVMSSVSRIVSAFLVVYLNLFIFIPKLLEKNKPWHYLLAIVSAILLVVYAIFLLNVLAIDNHTIMLSEISGRPKLIVLLFAQTIMLTILSSLIHFTKRWVKVKDLELVLKEAQRQRLESELKALKAQINPHFLFNSLNNIYSLSLDKSDLAPVMILKLSDLMSYILYDAGHEFVSFEKELEFVHNHIELEHIRVKNRAEISFEKDENLYNYQIAPLLFTPFIENAFKYLSNKPNEQAFINIIFKETGTGVEFSIQNSAEPERANFDHNNHGIGIENVKKRLQLIYPNKHTLSIEHLATTFSVNLKINML